MEKTTLITGFFRKTVTFVTKIRFRKPYAVAVSTGEDAESTPSALGSQEGAFRLESIDQALPGLPQDAVTDEILPPRAPEQDFSALVKDPKQRIEGTGHLDPDSIKDDWAV
jgi:hypothetical protein